MFPDDTQNIHSGRIGLAEHLGDHAFGIDVPRGPLGELDHHLVADLRIEGRLGVNVMDKPRIIREDVVKEFRFL